MDKDESYENVEQAQQHYAQELEQQHEDEEFINITKDNMSSATIDSQKNKMWLIRYFLEQSKLFPINHKECVKRTNRKLNKENKDGR